jgi:hypothetical protein
MATETATIHGGGETDEDDVEDDDAASGQGRAARAAATMATVADEDDGDVDKEPEQGTRARRTAPSITTPAVYTGGAWAALPVEVLERILYYAGAEVATLLRCEAVCVRWRKVTRSCARLWHAPRLAPVPAKALPGLFARMGRHFRVVSLRGRELPTESLRAIFARRLPHVVEVDLRFTVKITSPVLRAVAKACRALRVFHLSLSILPAGLRPEGLATLYLCHQLRYLNLGESQLSLDMRLSRYSTGAGAGRARDDGAGGPLLLARSSHRIGGFARQLTDAALAAVLDGCPALEELYVCGCKALTAVAAHKLAAQPHLRVLDCSFCDGLSAPGLRAIAAGCAHLEVLFAGFCPLTWDDVQRMTAARPRLQIHGLRELQPPARPALPAPGPRRRAPGPPPPIRPAPGPPLEPHALAQILWQTGID